MHPFRILIEKVTAESEIKKIALPVSEDKLEPVLSKELMNFHYGTLYSNYVKKALAGEGKFQIAGAKLHTLFFEQFQEPKLSNNPFDEIKYFIDSEFGNYEAFKDEFIKAGLELHGSGWIYLSTDGSIKTISNHELRDDILILVDVWEHSYQNDYGANKEKYLKEIWKIIDWNVINERR